MGGKSTAAGAAGTVMLGMTVLATALAGCDREVRRAPLQTVSGRPDAASWAQPGGTAESSLPRDDLARRNGGPDDGEAPTWTPARQTAAQKREEKTATAQGLCVDPGEFVEKCTEARTRHRPAGPGMERPPHVPQAMDTQEPWHRLGQDLYATDADRELAARIRRAIAPDNTAQAFNRVQVQVRDGVVTLRGQVDSEIDRASARERAAGVAGPHAVYDLIGLEP